MSTLKPVVHEVREFMRTMWPVVLLLLVCLIGAYQFVEPAPPKKVVITTGSETGAYYRFAKLYAEQLAKSGITLEVKTSKGSLENLDRLHNGEAQIALIQGGIDVPETPAGQEPSLYSLGSMFYEPIWVFYRQNKEPDRELDRLVQLNGKRIAIGQEGSGVRALATKLLTANQIPLDAQHALPLSGDKAAAALEKGEIDAMFVIAAPEAKIVQQLLHMPGVRLLNFAQADGYTRYFPFLSHIDFPEGAVDLYKNIPPHNTKLVAATANLVVRADLHPAMTNLLLQAATEVHGKAGFFQKNGDFPGVKDYSLPIAEDAEHFYKSGPPFLQRYLPFWLAVLIDRLLVMLVPILALVLPLVKAAPAIYTWRIRSKIFRCYGELKFLEDEIRDNFQAEKAEQYEKEITTLAHTAENLSIPVAFSDMHYTLREHIDLVHEILKRKVEAISTNPSSTP